MELSEQYSRVHIDRKLQEVGWDILDPSQIVFEDHGTAGRADYVLKDSSNRPIAIIEAKRPDLDPYTAKNQAFEYVKLQYPSVDFIYLANDNIIYFWDLGQGDAKPVSAFFSQSDLEYRRNRAGLGNVEPLLQKTVTDDYFQDITDSIKLRKYQLAAYEAIAHGFSSGKRSFLLEMATGTGKTVLAGLLISKFLRTNNAHNVLFIVDRKSLAIQTRGAFEQILRGVSAIGTYWGSNRRNLTGANVVIATIQSLQLHGRRDFSPGYFDLIIHDEAHRSIYSPEARAVVEYFVGATKIGMTATPKDFLKNIDIDVLHESDPRRLEKRLQRDTYTYFECSAGVPTYRYSIQDGVKDGYLVPANHHKMNTNITQKALGEELTQIQDIELESETSLKISDLERKVSFPRRNQAMMQEFLDYASKTPTGVIGKTLIFAVSQKHALELEKILNELKPDYNGHFAKTITSNVVGAHDLAKDFAREQNTLPRVAVTVDMLSTGFDCPEILNIVLSRPIFEPSTYVQIKGRGTRPCKEINKTHFTIYDFCGVIEYFDETYDWTAPLPQPGTRVVAGISFQTTEVDGVDRKDINTTFDNGNTIDRNIPTTMEPDFVNTRDQMVVGPDGDVVDRNMYQDAWTKDARIFAEKHAELLDDDNPDPDKETKLDEALNAELLNTPKNYFNEDTLQHTYRVIATVRDFLFSATGKARLPDRERQLEDLTNGLIEKYAYDIEGNKNRKTLMVKFIVNHLSQDDELLNELRYNPNIRFLQKPEFQQVFSISEWLDEFGKEKLSDVVSDITNSRLLNL